VSGSLERIGGGAIGGKASSLELIQDTVLCHLEPGEFPGFEVDIPRLAVLGTDVFDAFMALNRIDPARFADQPDDRIAHAVQRADFPAAVVGEIRSLVRTMRGPVAVRSSSLLEDALDHPFAGVYATKMIPNNQPDPNVRFRKLIQAIKFVYASTFFRAARSYADSIDGDFAAEKMAVIVQEVVGRPRNERFYPTFSGVARSFNYYPVGRSKPEQGVVDLALGLGKTIVDGGLAWTYCPARPQAPAPFGGPRDVLRNTQKKFWAVHLGAPPLPDPIRETEYMVQAGLPDAEYDDALRYIASTYDGPSDRLVPGVHTRGPRAIDFAPLLQFDDIPLNRLLKRLLALAEDAVGAAVEMEFAVDLDRERGLPARIGLLQVRPMAVCEEAVALTPDQMTCDQRLLSSVHVLGNGRRDDIVDIVFEDPDTFEPSMSLDIAGEVERFNEQLVAEGRPYLLLGFGRWGSSDPWLGVPVEWSQITGARVIVEATLPSMHPDPSQGSHFFQNLIAFQILYFSVRHDGEHRVDWDWLRSQPVTGQGRYVKHVRLPRPLTVLADGAHGRGVIQHHE
jgi:hypothetical protein